MSGQACGFFGRYLEIDLTAGRIDVRPLAAAVIADYIGGRGLATRLFCDAADPGADPLGPENVIVIAASPLVGTNAPTAARGHMVFKSPLTGFLGTSNSGGGWGFSPAAVEIHPAGELWGKDIHETTAGLTAGFAAADRPRVLCIGPAGENLVRFADVANDKNRVYGRGGPGAVWGSKNLKAVRVSGREKIRIADPEKYKSGYDQALYLLRQAPVTKRILRELGTAGLVELINVIEMLPHENFRDCTHREEDLERISGETIARTILERAAGCYLCPIGCQRHTRIRRAGSADETGEGPEYETVVLMGPACGIYDLAAITTANYRCNELGLDTISFGGTVACAMELFEAGLLSKEAANGFDLRFGNAAVLERLAVETAHRRGLGDLLAEGSFRLGEKFGRADLSMSVKRMEIPAYDPRASFTQALGYMTSPSGACHLRGGYAVSLAFFGGTKEIPRFSLLQSPIAIRNMQNTGILQDSLGICRFTGYAFGSDPWARMLSGVTGMDFSVARLEEVENRVAALERLFNLAAGARPEDDALPPRFADEDILVAGEMRRLTRESQDRMRRDYYRVRGWDEEGRPTEALLSSLRLARLGRRPA
jgi:aldehyde:ferredoxin oxidoreductase